MYRFAARFSALLHAPMSCCQLVPACKFQSTGKEQTMRFMHIDRRIAQLRTMQTATPATMSVSSYSFNAHSPEDIR
jgi:hypothetical protein